MILLEMHHLRSAMAWLTSQESKGCEESGEAPMGTLIRVYSWEADRGL